MASKLELVQELQLKADTKNLIIHVQTELGAMEKLIDNNLIDYIKPDYIFEFRIERFLL